MLAEAFHWTPQQIGRLTLPQVKMYLDKEKPRKGKRVSQAAAQAMLAKQWAATA